MSKQQTKLGYRVDLTDEEILFIRRGLTKEINNWKDGGFRDTNEPIIKITNLKTAFEYLLDHRIIEVNKISKLDPMRLTFDDEQETQSENGTS